MTEGTVAGMASAIVTRGVVTVQAVNRNPSDETVARLQYFETFSSTSLPVTV